MIHGAAGKATAVHGQLGVQGLVELLAAAAHAFRRHQALQVPRSGLAADRLLHLFEAYRGTHPMSSDERFRIMLILQQIVVTTRGTEHAADPTSDLLADFLAARHAARLLRQDPGAIVAAAGDPHVASTAAFEQCLVQEFLDDPDLARAVVKASGETSGESAANFICGIAATALAPALSAPAAAPAKSFFERLAGRF